VVMLSGTTPGREEGTEEDGREEDGREKSAGTA
jgi:hypothetical protein